MLLFGSGCCEANNCFFVGSSPVNEAVPFREFKDLRDYRYSIVK